MHSLPAASAFENWRVHGPAHSNQQRAREGKPNPRINSSVPTAVTGEQFHERGQKPHPWRMTTPVARPREGSCNQLSPEWTPCPPPCLNSMLLHTSKIYQAMDKTDKRHALEATFWKASNLKSLTLFVFFFPILDSSNLQFQAVITEGTFTALLSSEDEERAVPWLLGCASLYLALV